MHIKSSILRLAILLMLAALLPACRGDERDCNDCLRSAADSIDSRWIISMNIADDMRWAWETAIRDGVRDVDGVLAQKKQSLAKSIDDMLKSQARIDSLMNRIDPDVMLRCRVKYDVLVKFYNDYVQLNKLAITPSGTLRDYENSIQGHITKCGYLTEDLIYLGVLRKNVDSSSR